MWTLLQEKGILVQPLYMSIWRECKASDFSPEAIIELLVSFRLATEVTTKKFFDQPVKKYFLPAMLKSFKRDPSEAPTSYHLQATPLHITFNTKFVPPGFFTRFVKSFARWPSCKHVCKHCLQTNNPHYVVIGDEQLSSVPICCGKNPSYHKPSAEEAVWFKREIIQKQVCIHHIS